MFVKVSQVDEAHEYLITRSEDLPNLSGETSMARGTGSTICHYYTTLHTIHLTTTDNTSACDTSNNSLKTTNTAETRTNNKINNLLLLFCILSRQNCFLSDHGIVDTVNVILLLLKPNPIFSKTSNCDSSSKLS